MRTIFSASNDEENKYGLRYFDKTPAGTEDESENDEDDEEHDEKSCPKDCCDRDCECDDCTRCLGADLKEDDGFEVPAAAA